MLFWEFLFYGFGGYLLEKWYARRTHAEKQNRKGLILLPLCPVYGLAMAAVLTLPAPLRSWPVLPLTAAAVCSAAEYGYHWVCQAVFGVKFWDYTGVAGNVNGRICLPFSLLWGGLGALALTAIQPGLTVLLRRIPPAATFAAVLLFTADAACSLRLLRLTRDTEQLRLQTLFPAKTPPETDSDL
jgi:uncharacterized membrane protein